MPIQECKENGKPGFKYGKSGKCYVYESGNESAKESARDKARKQGAAVKLSQMREGKSE